MSTEPTQSREPVKWEYRHLKCKGADFIEMANELGLYGWELVNVAFSPRDWETLGIFKRALEPKS